MHENLNANNEENRQETVQIVANVIDKIINNTLLSNFSQGSAAPSYHPSIINDVTSTIYESKRNKSQIPRVHSNQGEIKPTLEIFRTGQFNESQSDIEVGHCTSHTDRNGPLPTDSCVPPSYSTVIKQGRPSLDIRRDARSMETQHLNAFTRVPPPSYAEIHGVWSREFSNASCM